MSLDEQRAWILHHLPTTTQEREPEMEAALQIVAQRESQSPWNSYLQGHFHLRRNRLEEAQAALRQAVSISQQQQDTVMQVLAQMAELVIYQRIQPDSHMVRLAEGALQTAHAYGDSALVGIAQEQYAASLATSGQDRRALQEYAKVETYLSSILATTHPDLRLHARMLYARTKMNLGAFFVGQIVNLANGMEYLDDAQAMFEELENPIMLAQCMYARGLGYFQFYKYEKAATLFEYAAQEFERWDHPYGVAVVRMALVGAYVSGNIQVEKALEAIELARPWIEQSQNGKIQAMFLVNQGLLKQWGMNQPDQALSLYQQAYDLADSLGHSLARLNAQLRIAGFYLYGDDPTKAIELSGQVAELARENGYVKIELGGLYGLAYGLQKAERYEEAFQATWDYSLAKDKIYSAKEHSAIAWATEHHMTRVYQDSVAQSRQALQTEVQQRKTLQAITGGTTIGLVLLGILAIVLYRARQRARRDAAHIRELSKEVHHRTKNNLQMLSNLLNLQMNRQPEGGEVHQALDSTKTRVAAISRLHHLLYDNDQLTRISLPELVQNLTNDLREAAGLSESAVRIKTAVLPIQVDAGRAVPLTLILNEWLTNAFKYAVPSTEAPTILIEFKQLGDERMMLVFSDNGPGYDPSQRREGSYGTDLVRSMVRQLGGHLDLNLSNGTQYLLQFRNPATT